MLGQSAIWALNYNVQRDCDGCEVFIWFALGFLTFSSLTTTVIPFNSRSSSVSPSHSATMLNFTMRRASSLRWFALRCSLDARDTPVTVGMEVRARSPIIVQVFGGMRY